MTEDHLDVLRSLAAKPTRTISASEKPKIIKLLGDGCVTYGPHGWIATPIGCAVLEQMRSTSH